MTPPPPQTGRLLPAGIGAAEEHTYERLLEHPGASLEEISASTNISRVQARKLLHALEEKGLVSRSPAKQPRYLPVPPDVAVELLILGKQEELERTRLAVHELTAKFRHTAEGDHPLHLVEVVSGRTAFAQRYNQLQRSATTEVLALDKPPYMAAPDDCREGERVRLRRGVRWRGIYARDSLEVPGTLDSIRELAKAGEEARTLSNVPLKLAIADRRVGLIPLNVEPGREEAVVLHASALLDALLTLFDTLWERAVPIGASNGHVAALGHLPLADADERLVDLLAAGLKDQAIATQLGLAFSTVERRIRRLMHLVGASTRVQLGLQLALRGWVGGPEAPKYAGRGADSGVQP